MRSFQKYKRHGTEILKEKIQKQRDSLQECSREVIQRGADQLGWELEKLLTMTMEAMKATEDTINAECESLVKQIEILNPKVNRLFDNWFTFGYFYNSCDRGFLKNS